MRLIPWLISLSLLCDVAVGALHAQSTPKVEFDVVSIKRNTDEQAGGGMRTLPDGTFIMTNQPISSVIRSTATVPVREVEGLPDWAMRERYDITAKPPAGSTSQQRTAMWQAMFAERMNYSGHIEQRERDTFALVMAREDRQLGPQLKPSALDCSPRPPGSPPPPPPTFTAGDAAGRCGGMFGNGMIVSGGIALDSLVVSLSGLAGRQIINRTGLQGFYALTLKYSTPRARPGAEPPPVDEAPEIFTALQEQLGLKLQPEKSVLPILVVDRIERPTEN
jgi:uncharacterized protein (TIGR03435 family)